MRLRYDANTLSRELGWIVATPRQGGAAHMLHGLNAGPAIVNFIAHRLGGPAIIGDRE